MPDDNKDAERLAQLEAEVAALKAKQPKPQPSFEQMERDAAKYRDEMHQMRERNASHIPGWMRAACAGGVTDADAALCVPLIDPLAQAAWHRPVKRSSAFALAAVQLALLAAVRAGLIQSRSHLPQAFARSTLCASLTTCVSEQNFNESWGKDEPEP